MSPPIPFLGGRGSKLWPVPRASPKCHAFLEAAGAWSCYYPSSREATGISARAGDRRVLGIGSTAQLPSRRHEGRWLDSLDKHRACVPAGSVAWAGPTNPGHQQQVSGVAAHPHSRTTGRGMPAGQQACIHHQKGAERSSFASGRILVRAHTHIAAAASLWWTTLLSQYRAIVVWGEDRPPSFQWGSLGSNLSSATYHPRDRGGRAGLQGPSGRHL